MHIGLSPNSPTPAISKPAAASLFAGVETGKVDVTGVAGGVTQIELGKLPTFAGMAIYRYEGYPVT